MWLSVRGTVMVSLISLSISAGVARNVSEKLEYGWVE